MKTKFPRQTAGGDKQIKGVLIVRKAVIFGCLLILMNQTMFGQTEIIPITIGNYLIGGTQNGKWLTDEQVVKAVEKETKFIGLNPNMVKKRDALFGTFAFSSEACGNYYLFFASAAGTALPPRESLTESSGLQPKLALGANAKWNPFPRVPRKISRTAPNYTKIIADFLKTKRITKTKIVITDAVGIDLDGDGAEELILSATYFKNAGNAERRAAGDYSLTMIRKIIGGKPQNILLEGEFFTRNAGSDLNMTYPEMYPTVTKPAIYAIADLNGDGNLEIILHAVNIFSLKDNKAIAVLEGDLCIN